MVKFNILGSCVCRDIFNHGNSNFQVNKYTNGSSLPSMCADAPKLKLDISDFKFSSNFEKRSALIDFNKSSFEYIASEKSDYLLISLSDNRIDLAEIYDKNGNFINIITFGTTFKENYNEISQLKECKFKIYKPLQLPLSLYFHNIDIFVGKILQMYPRDKIIVIEDLFTDTYYSKKNELANFQNTQYVKDINNFYRLLYSKLYEKLNTNNIIELPNNAIGSEEHKLGLFGLHYVDEVYEYANTVIEEIVGGKFDQKVGRTLKLNIENKITKKYFNKQ